MSDENQIPETGPVAEALPAAEVVSENLGVEAKPLPTQAQSARRKSSGKKIRRAKSKPLSPAKPTKPLQLGKTFQVGEKTRDRKWHVIDAKGQVLGRLCCEIVRLLTGKRKPDYTRHCDSGDFVIVINAGEITFSGKRKADQTKYHSYSGYPGGLRAESLGELLERMPEKVIWNTVNGMLPKATNRRSILLRKLKIYAGATHPHAAQSPTLISSLPSL